MSLRGTNAKAKANATQGIPEIIMIAKYKHFGLIKLKSIKGISAQLIVAKLTEKALAGWWRFTHLASILYLQRGAK